MDETELKARTKTFALRCLRLADRLPKTVSGRAIAQQLADCGSSVGANYRSACRGRSKPEFMAKLGVVEEEADEAGFRRECVVEHGLKPEHLVRPVVDEPDQLTRIMAASIMSARRSIQNHKSKIQNR